MTKKIKEDMQRRGMNQVEYGRLFGVDRSTVNKWLTGDRSPSRQALMLMELNTGTLIALKEAVLK